LTDLTLILGSTWAGKQMMNAADSYVSKTTPPMSRKGSEMGDGKGSDVASTTSVNTTSGRPALTFSPKIHATSKQIKTFSGTATTVSGRTRDAVLGVASKVGDRIGKTTGVQQTVKSDGTVSNPKGFRGVLNRSLIAANVVLDGVTKSAEQILKDGGEASGRVIEHRYGSEVRRQGWDLSNKWCMADLNSQFQIGTSHQWQYGLSRTICFCHLQGHQWSSS